jgi:transcriptional regulator with XRE-family HTH domain
VIIGDLVLAKRLHSGWTQAQLAARVGVQQKTISRIEAGDPGVEIGTLDKVMQSMSDRITILGKETVIQQKDAIKKESMDMSTTSRMSDKV